MAYGNIGNTYLHRGDYGKAMAFYHRQISLASDIGDIRSLSAVSCNVGLLCKRQGRLEESIENFKKAIDSGRRIGYARVYTLSTGNLGSVYLFLGRWEEARAALSSFLEMSEQAGDVSCMVIAYGNLNALERLTGRREKAWEHISKAVELAEGHKLDSLSPVVLNLAAEQLMESGEHGAAASYAARADQAAKKAGDEEQAGRAAVLAAAARAVKGDKNALTELESYAQRTDDEELAFLACGYCYQYGKKPETLARLKALGTELFKKTGNIQFQLELEKMTA
jgi:tetratricopeptide (TPR) repeat protein